MSTINFKNVGQGDSIIIEWDNEGEKKIGIIDCNLHNYKNPVVDYISQKTITEIEFLILSHFHYDHFSGMPDLLNYCNKNKITIKWFLHTLAPCCINIYDKIFTSKRLEKAIIDFFKSVEDSDKYILNDLSVNSHTPPIYLSASMSLTFFSPSEKTCLKIAKQLNRKIGKKELSYDDINQYSAITYIQKDDKGILLTSDSLKAEYKNFHNNIKKEILLVQVPHHGSFNSIYPNFWTTLKKKSKCPAIFSVGYEPKDKLPKKETVKFFDKLDFDIYSTNYVFGISEYFKDVLNIINHNKKTQYLNLFSKKANLSELNATNESKYEGDQIFTF